MKRRNIADNKISFNTAECYRRNHNYHIYNYFEYLNIILLFFGFQIKISVTKSNKFS